MSILAIKGGAPVRDVKINPWPNWPVWDEKEEEGILEVLRSGIWSYNGPKEKEFNKMYANYIGTKYSICAANGTITLQLILEGLGIGLGDEVIVPGLTWQATAASVLDLNAVPVLVDVTEDTWCIDPAAIEAAITPKTKAIIPVHLYGCFSDMDAILEIAKKYGLKVVEDCAHKHGGEWRGKKAGSIGDAGSFSFQLSKLMTSGEGGAITTSDKGLYEKLDALRNCGRKPELEELKEKGSGIYNDEGNFIQSGNYRITDFQAAILIQELKRLPEQTLHRESNALYLNQLLDELPGIKQMKRDERETLGAYYNVSFRFFKNEFKDLSVSKFREALSKELGCTVEPSYEPLNDCSLYAPYTKPWRYKLNDQHWAEVNPKRFELPVCKRIFSEESVCFHLSILNGTKSNIDQIAEAIEKIYKHAEELL